MKARTLAVAFGAVLAPQAVVVAFGAVLTPRAVAVALGAVLAQHAVAADLNDPMRPPSAPAAAVSSRPDAPATLRLQAVIGTAASRVAIVNGKLVRVGDKIHGALIAEISADRVVYIRGGKQLVASLPDTQLSVRTNKTLQAGQP